MFNQSEIDDAAEKEVPLFSVGYEENIARNSFKAGVKWAVSKIQEIFTNLIIENQGLKMNQDLSIEFGDYIGKNGYTFYKNSWFDIANHSLDCNTKELFNSFLTERNE
jgi:hypothetical protein